MDPSTCACRLLLRRYCTAALAAIIFWPGVASAQRATQVITPGPSASPSSTVPQAILLPGGTTVSVGLTEPISSATANVNDQVAIVVRKADDVAGWAVIPAGANGHATVTSVEHSAGNGSGGKLAMTIDWVYSADGGRVQLSTTNHASESGDTKGAASTATILSWVLLGPLGFFAHNFVHGKDVTIGTDRTFTVFVDHDVHIEATQKAGQGQGFDR